MQPLGTGILVANHPSSEAVWADYRFIRTLYRMASSEDRPTSRQEFLDIRRRNKKAGRSSGKTPDKDTWAAAIVLDSPHDSGGAGQNSAG